MDVVLVGLHFLQNDVGVMLRPGSQKGLQIALNPFVEDTASVFGRPHQVVITLEDAMAHSPIHGHGL